MVPSVGVILAGNVDERDFDAGDVYCAGVVTDICFGSCGVVCGLEGFEMILESDFGLGHDGSKSFGFARLGEGDVFGGFVDKAVGLLVSGFVVTRIIWGWEIPVKMMGAGLYVRRYVSFL